MPRGPTLGLREELPSIGSLLLYLRGKFKKRNQALLEVAASEAHRRGLTVHEFLYLWVRDVRWDAQKWKEKKCE